MVEEEEVTGSLRRGPATPTPVMMSPMGNPTPYPRRVSTGQRMQTPMSDRYGSAKLYAQYLKEEKLLSSKPGADSRIDSARDSNSSDRITNHDPDEVLEL